MRNSTAYFAGVATVFTATALGFGGALIATNAVAPDLQKEPTKLERSANAAQGSSSANSKVAIVDPSRPNPVPSPPADAEPAPSQQPAQQVEIRGPQESQAVTATGTQGRAQSETPIASDIQSNSPANAYARTSQEDLRKYIRNQGRRWARRHYNDETTTSSTRVSDPPAGSANQPILDSQPVPAQQQTSIADDPSTRITDANGRKSARRHERYGRRYARDGDDRIRADDSTVEIRDVPREGPPQGFEMPPWRPFFRERDDD